MIIQGKVNPGIVKFRTTTRNQEWLFIDYAECSIPLDKAIQITAIQGDGGMLLSTSTGAYAFKILDCRDQFDNILKEIPQGWKTICKIEFQPEMPIWIQRLKLREGWGYHTEQIKIFYE